MRESYANDIKILLKFVDNEFIRIHGQEADTSFEGSESI